MTEGSPRDRGDSWVAFGRQLARASTRSRTFGAAALALLSGAATCEAGTLAAATGPDLYVSATGSDSNDGSQGAPFRSILLASEIAQPGTTVHVTPGNYEGGFITRTSGAVGAPIHYVSDVRWRAKITPAPKSTYDIAWDNRGAFVVIDGFEVDGSKTQKGTRWRLGIYTAGSHSAIMNSYVHHVATAIPCTNRGGAGIEGDSWSGASDIDLVGNIVHDIGPRSCTYVHGAYQTAPGTVANNLVYRVSGWGIHLWHDVRRVTVANNTVFNSANGGILVGGGDYVNTKGPADHITVANNIVFDNVRYGIIENGQTGSHNLFTHNLSNGNGVDWRLRTSAADPAAISADPKFVRYLRNGGGDYRLAPGSPAIGAGTPDHAPAIDLDGISRSNEKPCNMGAYESPASP